jgi:two-component system, NarL family, response regulator DegU
MTVNDPARRARSISTLVHEPQARRPTDAPLTVLIVDDHLLFRQGLRALLEHSNDVHVVGEADNGEDGIRLCRALQPNVVLMDLNLGEGMDGVQATRQILQEAPQTHVVVLSTHFSEEYALPAMKAGAKSYLVKSTGIDNVIRAVKLAATGGSMIDPLLTPVIMSEYRRMNGQRTERAKSGGLTERDIALLKLLAAGYNNRQISDELSLAESTVKNNLSALFQKIDVRDRTQAVLYAIDSGLIGRSGRK